MNILAVCTGNTCRSPIIMALVKKLYPDFCVDSAGIYALNEKVSENAVLALKEEDIDLSGYVSKPLTKELISKADIILTATEEHKAFIEAIEKNKKIISLNCPDPYGAPLDVYIKTKNYLLQKLKEIFLIKRFSNKDVPAKELSEIEKECFSAPWSEESFKNAQNTSFYVYFIDNEPVGYVGIFTVLDEGYITNIAVKKACRNKGVAKSLLKEIISVYKDLSFISLEVRKSNTPAIKLYEKFNFIKKGERKNFYSAPPEDALILTYFYGENL